MFFNKTIIGVDDIAKELEIDTVRVMEYFVHDYLPIVKIDGIWRSSKSELKEWRKQHGHLYAPQEIFVREKIKKPRPKRWGL